MRPDVAVKSDDAFEWETHCFVLVCSFHLVQQLNLKAWMQELSLEIVVLAFIGAVCFYSVA